MAGDGEALLQVEELGGIRPYWTSVAEPKPKGPNSQDIRPQIARRAYDIYEEWGRHDGQPDQDWIDAERETQKDEAEYAKAAAMSS